MAFVLAVRLLIVERAETSSQTPVTDLLAGTINIQKAIQTHGSGAKIMLISFDPIISFLGSYPKKIIKKQEKVVS